MIIKIYKGARVSPYMLPHKSDYANSPVVGMISAEKEKVPFIRKIDVNEGERKGNVEIWLMEIEKTMIETLIKITKDCQLDLNIPRTEWVQKWAG